MTAVRPPVPNEIMIIILIYFNRYVLLQSAMNSGIFNPLVSGIYTYSNVTIQLFYSLTNDDFKTEVDIFLCIQGKFCI